MKMFILESNVNTILAGTNGDHSAAEKRIYRNYRIGLITEEEMLTMINILSSKGKL